MAYKTFYVGGPCNGHHDEWDGLGAPPLTTVCRGADYEVSVEFSDRGRLVYVLKGSHLLDVQPEEVRGRRDVFVAFRRLMHGLAHDVPKDMGRVARASKRIRRAVR